MAVRGVHGFNKSDGTNKLLAAKDSYVFELSGSSWLNTGPLFTDTSNNVEFESFNDNVFVINGNDGDAMRSYDGTNWSLTSNVTNAPKAKYIKIFNQLLCLGYVNYNSKNFASRVWFANRPDENDNIEWDLETGTDLSTNAGQKAVVSLGSRFVSRGIQVGDTFVITAGDNKKEYSVASIDAETGVTLNQEVVNTGTSQTFWVGSNFFEVDTNDGDVITGLGENSGRLLIFKRRSLYRWNGTSAPEKVKGSPGTVSNRSIVTMKSLPVTIYFANIDGQAGFYAYDGKSTVLISRKVLDYINGISSSNYASTSAWQTGDLYKCYVGDITDTDKNISIAKAVFVYDISANAIWFESLGDTLQDTTTFVESGADNLYACNDGTQVFQLESGTTDDTVNYSWYVETGPIYTVSGSEINKEFQGLEIFVERGFGASVQYKIIGNENGNDDKEWRSIGQITNNLTTLDIPNHPRGRGIRIRLFREPIQEVIVLEKITVYYKPINNPFI